MLNAMIWLAGSGAPWRDLPERFDPWGTVYRRFRKWIDDGVIDNKDEGHPFGAVELGAFLLFDSESRNKSDFTAYLNILDIRFFCYL